MQKTIEPKAVWLLYNSYLALAITIWFMIALFVVPWIIDILTGDLNEHLILQLVVSAILLVVSGIILYPAAYLLRKSYKYELTDDTFKKEYGVMSKKYVSIPYDKIQNVEIRRSFLARILGLSELRIETAGASGISDAEGQLPGITVETAEKLREELMQKVKSNRTPGL